MVTQVNKLIYNALCKGSDVALPGIGSLIVRRSAATQDKKGFSAPKRSITFTGEQRGQSVVELIAATAGVDSTRAEEIYAQWQQSVNKDSEIVIEGVGTIANRKFAANASLKSALNPSLGVAATPKAKGSNKGVVVAVVVVLLLALAAAAYFIFGNKEEVVVPEPVVEVVTPEPEPAPEPQPIKEEGVERMVEGNSYLVWGVFSQKANADRYQRLIEGRYGHLHCTIYHYKEDTMYMLAVYGSSSRNACANKMLELQELDGMFDEMWIYTNN